MIDSYTFGTFIIDGKKFDSNVKIIQDKASKYRYFENHIIELNDFVDLVDKKPEYIIIGTGASGVVNVPDEIKEYIEKAGIKLIIEKTGDACNTYNDLIKKNKKVCALMHNTC
ncbi:hypothetical protein KY345_05450 [Candidatus Woesearchaeota archaeon]|nr:hypothetical protein [Candidatus Woesearchaeota archaeon]